MHIPSSTDRRVQRTRGTLRQALIALLHERPWDDISVQDICDRADVGRSTFYTHFADKEELLVGGFDDLRKAIRAGRAAATEAGPLGFARGLIEHAHENLRLFRALVGRRSGQVVLQRFRELVVDLVRDDLAPLAPPGLARDAAVHFIAGGLLELLTWSLECRSPPPPAEVTAHFLRLATPALPAAGPTGAPAARARS